MRAACSRGGSRRTGGVGDGGLPWDRAVARRFATEGASVAIHHASRENAAASLLAELGDGQHMTVRADVGDPEEVVSLAGRVIDRFGRIDVLVNNAGGVAVRCVAGLVAPARTRTSSPVRRAADRDC